MKLIVCLDDNNGMAFCGRRQSRDKQVCDRILALSEGSCLWISAYSSVLFPVERDWIRITQDPVGAAGPDDYCFVENFDVTTGVEAAQEVWVFRWNREYPSDIKFPLEQLKRRLKRTVVEEFVGNSHSLITLEVYKVEK